MAATGHCAHLFGPFVRSTGVPYSGARVFTYAGGTTTNKDTYTTETGSTVAANPLVCNTAGMVTGYLEGDYHIVVKASVADGGATLPDCDIDGWKFESKAATLRGENQAASYPAATAANLGQIFAKTSAGTITEVGINKSGSGFSALQFQGDTLTSTQSLAKGADIAAASALTLGSDGNYFVIASGSGPISSISTKAAGTRILLRYGINVLVSYNATSLILQGAVDRYMAIGDMQAIVSEGSGNWREEQYWPVTTEIPNRWYISGLTYANGSDAVNDIDIAAGECASMDSGASTRRLIRLSAITKQLDATWAVGTNAGGLDTGAVGNNDYYIWAIMRADTFVTDALFSLSSTGPTMPTGYTHKRLIGWFKRTGGTIVALKTSEDAGGGLRYMWTTPTTDIALSNTLTTSRRTDAVKVPLDFSVIAHVIATTLDAGANSVSVICDVDETDAAPSSSASPIGNIISSVGGNAEAVDAWVKTSSAGLVASRSTLATVDGYNVSTLGFLWARRN